MQRKIKRWIMEQSINNGPGHCGVAQVVGTTNFEEDEETRQFFTDSDGVHHTVVFTDPVTGERRFGGWKR